MNKDYIDGYMEGHSEGMAAGFNLMEKAGTRTHKDSDKPEPREFWINPGTGHYSTVNPANTCGDWIKVREVLDDE